MFWPDDVHCVSANAVAALLASPHAHGCRTVAFKRSATVACLPHAHIYLTRLHRLRGSTRTQWHNEEEEEEKVEKEKEVEIHVLSNTLPHLYREHKWNEHRLNVRRDVIVFSLLFFNFVWFCFFFSRSPLLCVYFVAFTHSVPLHFGVGVAFVCMCMWKTREKSGSASTTINNTTEI